MVVVTNPKGPEKGSDRVARGGSWSNGAYFLAVSRLSCHLHRRRNRYKGLGFRIACNVRHA